MAGPGKGNVDELLAASFKELALLQPIEKITIKEITDKAGVIRPTFYNHFQDKYELLEWIIRKETLDPIKPLVQAGMIDEALLLIFTALERDKEFYMKASRLEGQNSFGSIVQGCIQKLLLDIMKDHKMFLTPKNLWITPEHIAEYYAQSMCYVVMSWIKSGMAVTPREIVDIYNYIITHSMQEVLAVSYTHLDIKDPKGEYVCFPKECVWFMDVS